MGKDGSGAGTEGSPRTVKPPPDRLYGRSRGHKLRPRQEVLLDVTLERLRFRMEDAAAPAWMPELWLEIGFGGGEHALAQVAAYPHAGLIACEVFENGICSLLSALVPEGGEADAPLPPNLRLWPDDGRVLLRALPDACLDRLFLMFPDPWPKMRHAKRRFVHPELVPEVARVMKTGAQWRVASDDPTYQAWVTEVMSAQALFVAPKPAVSRPEGWPPHTIRSKSAAGRKGPVILDVYAAVAWSVSCAIFIRSDVSSSKAGSTAMTPKAHSA